jgi:hypothetical protein
VYSPSHENHERGRAVEYLIGLAIYLGLFVLLVMLLDRRR